jgi:hypothetical protein
MEGKSLEITQNETFETVELAVNRIAELKVELKDSQDLVAEQSKKIAELEKANTGNLTAVKEEFLVEVTVSKKTYCFTKAKFRIAGDATLHLATDVAENKELVKQILAMEGQSILKEKV